MLDGHFSIDVTSAILGVSHFNLDGDLMDIAASVLGAIVVLVVGSIWRRRKLQAQTQEAAGVARSALSYDFRLATNRHPDNWPLRRPNEHLRYRVTAASRARRSALNWLSDVFGSAGIGGVLGQFSAEIAHPQFWVNLSKIIWINVLLSGDNALVVAMACRSLAPRQRFWGMVLGTAAAVLLRIVFTVVVASVMGLPYLKLVGGLALIVIAAKLLVPRDEAHEAIGSASHLWAAVQIVVVADIVMSLDNVIAVAAAADGSLPLLIFGLASSIPLIIAGAALIMALLSHAADPDLGGLGACSGWIAGDVIATDPAVHPRLQALFEGAIGVELDAHADAARRCAAVRRRQWRRDRLRRAWRRSWC